MGENFWLSWEVRKQDSIISGLFSFCFLIAGPQDLFKPHALTPKHIGLCVSNVPSPSVWEVEKATQSSALGWGVVATTNSGSAMPKASPEGFSEHPGSHTQPRAKWGEAVGTGLAHLSNHECHMASTDTCLQQFSKWQQRQLWMCPCRPVAGTRKGTTLIYVS